MKEDKREKIVFRLYVLNLFLNVIFYFIVDSLNNINAILVFNLLTIGSIELFVAKDDNGAGFHIFRGVVLFLMIFVDQTFCKSHLTIHEVTLKMICNTNHQ